MIRDAASVRKVCLGLSVTMMQLFFVPAAVAKKKKHKDTEEKPAATAPVTPVAAAPAAAAPATGPASKPVAVAAAPVPAPAAVPPPPAAPVVVAPPAGPPPAAPPPPKPAVPSPALVAPPPPAPPVAAAPGEVPPADADAAALAAAEPMPESVPAAGSAGYDPSEMEVVKVTVDRREKNIQSYAGSASAYSQEDLQRVGVNSVRDMGAVSPSVEIGTQEGNTEIFIRGVGSTNNTELGDPSSATHVDGIYIPRPRGVGSMFFDLERVEVNRGPQGTIRGRNATAGSINIITAKPKLSLWEASGEMQIGNYSQRLATAMVNIPIGDKLALRLAAFGEEHDPFFKNAGPVKTNAAGESADNLAYRASAKWTPVSRLTVLAGTDFTQENGTGFSGSNFNAALKAGILPSEIPDPRAVIYRGPQGVQRMQHWGVHTDITYDLGPVSLNYLGSYRHLKYFQNTGGNAGVAYPGQIITDMQLDNWSTSYWDSASQSQVHELRAYTPDSWRFRGTAGVFVFHEKQQVTLYSVADNTYGYAGNEYNEPNVKGDSQAAYLDGTYDFLKWLRGTAGLRFTHETKSRTDGFGGGFSVSNVNANGPFRFGTEGFQPALGNRTIYPALGSNLDPTQVFLNGITRSGARDTLQGLLQNGGAIGSVTPQYGTYSDNFLDFRLGADADLKPGHMVYVNLSTGHNSGGFNDQVDVPDGRGGMVPVAPTYKPERLYSIEVGSKNEFMDKKLRVNASAFLYLYRDQIFQIIQQTTPPDPNDPTSTGGSTALRVNAGKSHILGLEFDGAYQLPFGFVVSVAGTLLDARFDEGRIFDNRVAYGPTNGPNDKVDVSGKILPRAPRVTVNYSLAQNIKVPFGWFDWIVSAQTRSQYFMTVFNGEGVDSQGNVNPNLSDVVPRYTRVDLGAGYSRPDGKWRLGAFVSNLTNATYMTTFINTPDLNLRYFNPPRQMGVRLSLYW